MSDAFQGYQKVLVATDFSDHAENALRRAVWIAEHSSKRLVVAHVVADLRKAVHQTSYRSRIEFLEGDEEHFQRELRRQADDKLKRQISSLGATSVDIKYETILGEPYQELIHSVLQEGYDLVVAGTRGQSALKRLLVGSTARRLVRHCPASVWIVRNKEAKPPTSIVAAVDMSEVSRRALDQAIWTARQTSARLHVIHVIESPGLSGELLDKNVAGDPPKSLRKLIDSEVAQQFHNFLSASDYADVNASTHLVWGSPADAMLRFGEEVQADLIVLGTVGRRGVEGLLLGNTAETILAHAHCDVLTVKPAGFVSSIAPASWPLHPGPATPK